MSYIKLHRDLLDSYSFANAKHLKIWIWLLLKANYKDAFISIPTGKGEATIELKRGQLIFGRLKAEEELCMDGSFIYRTLQKFVELGQISIKVNSHNSVITICKYDSYQGKENESEQAMNSQCTGNEQHMNNTCTTHEQHMNIYKEELEELESKEEKELLLADLEILPEIHIKKIIEYYYFQTQKLMQPDDVIKFWSIFKTFNFNLNNYKSIDKVYNHFMYWIKNQKYESTNNKSESEKRMQQYQNYVDQFAGDSKP